MALPDVNQSVRDGGLGIVNTDADKLHVKIGVSSAGTVNTPVKTSDPQTVQSSFGSGPLAESMAFALAQPGAGEVMGIRVNGSVAGALSSVTKSGSGTGTVTVAGPPLDDYDVRVQVVQQGTNIAAGTATFKYSLDGGRTYSPELAVPTSGTYVIPNTGITLTFTNGGSGTSFLPGDLHSFTATAPGYTVSDLNAAIDAAMASAEDFRFLHVVGAAADAAGAATVAGAIASKLGTAFNGKRYVRAMMELPDVADNLLLAAFASIVEPRLLAAGGYAAVTSAISGIVAKRSAGLLIAARAGAVDLGVDLAKVKAEGGGGPLGGVQALYRDERKTGGFDTARISSLRTFVRKPGYYISNGKLLASPGSDFELWQHGVVMDAACATTYAALVEYLSDEIQVDAKTGLILEEEAGAIEGDLESQLRARLVDGRRRAVSAVQAIVDRTINVLSLKKLVVRVRITPLLYPKSIETELAYANPALKVVPT